MAMKSRARYYESQVLGGLDFETRSDRLISIAYFMSYLPQVSAKAYINRHMTIRYVQRHVAYLAKIVLCSKTFTITVQFYPSKIHRKANRIGR